MVISHFHSFSTVRLFLIFWSLILPIHESDTWDRPWVAALAALCFISTFIVKSEKLAWAIALVPVTAVVLYFWPYNANHLSFVLVANLYLLSWFFRKGPIDIDEVLNFLFCALGIVYLWAFFHKLNTDFLNPEVSCANQLVSRFLGRLGVEENPLAFAMPVLALIMEFVIGVGLLIPRFRSWTIILSLIFHVSIVWANFVNFASIPLVLYLCAGIRSAELNDKILLKRLKTISLVYLSIQVIPFSLGPYEFWADGAQYSYYASASIWTLATLAFLWNWISSNKILAPAKYSKAMSFFLIPVVLLGTQNYLGLGTSNSFSMFSNLKTEGGSWNHLLIPKETQLFKLQENIFYTDQISPEFTRTVRDFPTAGLGMPLIEVYRLYNVWGSEGIFPPVFTLRKEGATASVEAVRLLPPDQRDFSWIYLKLFHFRGVQYLGPNACRW